MFHNKITPEQESGHIIIEAVYTMRQSIKAYRRRCILNMAKQLRAQPVLPAHRNDASRQVTHIRQPWNRINHCITDRPSAMRYDPGARARSQSHFQFFRPDGQPPGIGRNDRGMDGIECRGFSRTIIADLNVDAERPPLMILI